MKALQKVSTLIATGLAFIFLTGCASIISGRHQAVTFTSNPDDAVVTIDGRQIGKTPITAQLERKGGAQVVTISKDGYKTATFQLHSTVNGWFFGNLIIGGLLGSSTDSSTGAINAYSQDMFNFSLTPIGDSMMPQKTEIKTYVIANYKNLIEELNIRPSEVDPKAHQTTVVETPKPYLKALFALMKVKQDQEEYFTQAIKKLADANQDIVVFADQVTNLAQ
jgi:PEGA domain